jgi:hypothetical protein
VVGKKGGGIAVANVNKDLHSIFKMTIRRSAAGRSPAPASVPCPTPACASHPAARSPRLPARGELRCRCEGVSGPYLSACAPPDWQRLRYAPNPWNPGAVICPLRPRPSRRPGG